MAKYTYHIVLNNEPLKKSIYSFDYGHTKNVELCISKNRIALTCSMSVKKSVDVLFSDKNNIFSEGLKKGLLLHLIHYSEAIKIKKYSIFINGEKQELPDTLAEFPIFSMVEGNLKCPFPSEWQNHDLIVQYILSRPKTKQGYLAASLYAFIQAKSKDFVTERFMYLWMAMNGLYNHIARVNGHKIVKRNPKDNAISEDRKMGLLCQTQHWHRFDFATNERLAVCERMDELIVSCNSNKEQINKEIREVLEAYKKLTSDSMASHDQIQYLTYPYYLRCRLFHANKPISLFALRNETEIICLDYVNKLLNDFLDEYLPLFFNEEYCKIS